MPTQRLYTVRAVIPRETMDELPGLWVEQLRYMGLVVILKDDPKALVLQFMPPRGIDTRGWATMNAQRMQSFGLCAVAAPAWDNSLTRDVLEPLKQVFGEEEVARGR